MNLIQILLLVGYLVWSYRSVKVLRSREAYNNHADLILSIFWLVITAVTGGVLLLNIIAETISRGTPEFLTTPLW